MLRDLKTLRIAVGKISEAASEIVNDEVIKPVLRSKGGVESNEENITAAIENRINVDLMKRIEKKLNGTKLKGVSISVHTYSKHTEEPKIGADLAGVLKIDLGKGNILTKVFLAQAKVCKLNGRMFPRIQLMYTRDPNVPKQAKDMLRITSDSFFFLYTDIGVYVVPALEVDLYNKIPKSPKNTIDTKDLFYKPIGAFYEEFFKCFIGDHLIADKYKKIDDLTALADVVSVINIKVDEDQAKNK